LSENVRVRSSTRMQRPRSSPPRSPLTRRPSGVAWLLIVTTAFAAAAPAEDPSTWPELSPPGGGFSIRMPEIPKDQNPAQGVHVFQFTRDQAMWVTSFIALTGDMKKKPAQEYLDELRAAFLQMLPESKLVSSASWSAGGFPGIKCVIDAHAEGQPEYRLKMTGLVTSDRLISFGYSCRKEAFVESAVDSYLATFRLD